MTPGTDARPRPLFHPAPPRGPAGRAVRVDFQRSVVRPIWRGRKMPVEKKEQLAAKALARCREETKKGLLWLLRSDPGESLEAAPPRPLGAVSAPLVEMLDNGWKEGRRPAELNDAE